MISTFALTLIITQTGGPSTNGLTAQIKPQHKQQVRAGKLRILAPTYVPSGFKLTKFTVYQDKEPALRDVNLIYAGTGKKKFTIQFASDGLGDPFFDLPGGDVAEKSGTLKCKSPIFGNFDLDFAKQGDYLGWHTTWYEFNPKGFPKYVLIWGEGFGPQDGKRIAESLRWLDTK